MPGHSTVLPGELAWVRPDVAGSTAMPMTSGFNAAPALTTILRLNVTHS